jgi:sugar (pentulose or hexulose) kinase
MSTVGINAQQLAAVHLPGQPVGTISHGAGEAFGLPNGTVIAGGGHDQFCNALGSGATSHQPMWSTGTVDSVTFLVDRPPADLHPSVPCYPVDHDRYSVPFANLNGGAALAWLARLFGKDPAALLADAVYDPGRLWVLPLFGVTGAPDYDTDASGTLHGLRYSDTRASIAAALVEGVVLETRYALEANGAPLKQIQAVNLAGGGAQSRYWADLKASALHCPAYIRRHFDAGCVGAAMLAWEALTGQRPDIEQTNAVVDVVEPSASEMIATRFERYRYLREAFRPLSSS